MTALAESAQSDAEVVSEPKGAVVGIMAGEGVQIPALLDANAPASVMIEPLLKVVNSRLRELGETPLQAKGRGRWALCLVDGTPLRPAQSLTEQEVFDGDRLWLRFIEDNERRSQVVEHISTAIAANFSKRFATIDPRIAVQVGSTMVAVGVTIATLLLAWWSWGHDSWLTPIFGAVIAVAVLSISTVILVRAKTPLDRQVGDTMLLSGLGPLAVAAAAAPPGPVGAPHAVLGFAVLGVATMLVLRFTGRRLGIYTTIVTICLAVTAASLVRMVTLAGAVTLLTCILLGCVLTYHAAPTLSRRLSGIRLPVFPSATGRWVFEARPDLPTTVVMSSGGPPTLEGPASVREVVLQAERARSFLTGLLVGLGLLVVVCTTALCDPHTGQRWLPILLAVSVAGFLLFRGRSYVDRWQSIILAATAVFIIAGLLVRYAVGLASPAAMSTAVAILVLLPAAGLIAAQVVPNTIYSPLFRKLVEWIEYLCLMPIFPLGLWLMDVYAAIRYR